MLHNVWILRKFNSARYTFHYLCTFNDVFNLSLYFLTPLVLFSIYVTTDMNVNARAANAYLIRIRTRKKERKNATHMYINIQRCFRSRSLHIYETCLAIAKILEFRPLFRICFSSNDILLRSMTVSLPTGIGRSSHWKFDFQHLRRYAARPEFYRCIRYGDSRKCRNTRIHLRTYYVRYSSAFWNFATSVTKRQRYVSDANVCERSESIRGNYKRRSKWKSSIDSIKRENRWAREISNDKYWNIFNNITLSTNVWNKEYLIFTFEEIFQKFVFVELNRSNSMWINSIESNGIFFVISCNWRVSRWKY